LGKRFLIVVFLSANRARSVIASGSLKPFEAFEALFVKNMRTTKDLLLFLQIQVLKANGTAMIFFFVGSLHVHLLDVLPLSKCQRQLRPLDQSQFFCQGEIFDIFHSFAFDVELLLLFFRSLLL